MLAMIRDLLIVADAVGEAAGPYGVALAKHLGAATSCLCLQPEDDRGLAEVRFDLVVSARDEALRTVREAAENLAYAARAAEVPAETETIHGGPDVLRAQLLARARMHDLVVVEQPSRRRDRPADAYVEDILLGAGRPTLVVPTGWIEPARLDAVTVAWDGSAAAARALGDALPLLKRARRVGIVTVQTEAVAGVGEGGDRLVRHLARHGVEADYRTTFSSVTVVGHLIAEVAQAGSDLLVMGAYGHSRLREAFLGGASRDALRQSGVPVLMSH
ncbi:universal stress protein UspA [Methylobacterium oryzae]|uniref:Universal stress protein UspA n=2 Tax=Methylobacterium oryzae TaxID=334852 RepID=A0ABU7TN66_9HYPH